jgi:hypothetical protein
MTIEYGETQASFRDLVDVNGAEALLQWLQSHPLASVDLSACTHVHSANVQVLMAAQPRIAAWPTDQGLASWLQSVLKHE